MKTPFLIVKGVRAHNGTMTPPSYADIELYIEPNRLAQLLGPKAIRSKGRKATLQQGTIKLVATRLRSEP